MRATRSPSPCPVDSVLRLLMGPWTSYILYLLHTDGAKRFGAFKNAMPAISAKVLTERLRMLEEAGLVVRHYKPTVPPEVSYSLSSRGGDLQGVLNAVGELAKKWQEEERQASTPA